MLFCENILYQIGVFEVRRVLGKVGKAFRNAFVVPELLVFVLLLVYRKHKKFDGEICLLYLGGYGIGRFIIEGIRTDTLFVPGTTVPVSQVLALGMVVAAIGIDILVRVRLKKRTVEKNNNNIKKIYE